jgi:hypothetical protein
MWDMSLRDGDQSKRHGLNNVMGTSILLSTGINSLTSFAHVSKSKPQTSITQLMHWTLPLLMSRSRPKTCCVQRVFSKLTVAMTTGCKSEENFTNFAKKKALFLAQGLVQKCTIYVALQRKPGSALVLLEVSLHHWLDGYLRLPQILCLLSARFPA